MTRLPGPLQPLWPVMKAAHQRTALISGAVFRRLAWLFGDRALPRTATVTSSATAALEAPEVVLHDVGPAEEVGHVTPGPHPAYRFGETFRLGPRFVLEARGGVVVGDYAAVVTPGRRLDFETSPYFATPDWRQHPLFLRRRLPPIEEFDGTLLVLAARGGQASYYHFMFDVLPRWATFRAAFPEVTPDAIYLPRATRYHRELLELTGLDALPVVESAPDRAVRASRLLVPSESNEMEMAPQWMVDHVRASLPAARTEGLPRRLFITRGAGRNTRRWLQEEAAWPELERRGFVRIDPGTMTVRDQIDHFAAADTIVALHGAALTNLAFVRPGTKVLEVFAPTYVKHCYWVITEAIPDVQYSYLLGDGPLPRSDAEWLTGIQDDIDLSPARLLEAVDTLLVG
jgi:capsular polysaccharide biosynthesis protein